MSEWVLPVLNLLFYLLNTFVTFISMTGIFGPTNGDLAEKYMTLTTPAGYAFSIWGFIFVWEAVFVVACLFVPSLRESKILSEGVSLYWIAACIFQAAWTPAFSQEVLWLALVFMLALWISLGGILYKTYFMEYTRLEYWTLVGPFQMHFGWITAASLVNVNTVLVNCLGCDQDHYTNDCSERDVSKQLAAAALSLMIALMIGQKLSGTFCALEKSNPVSTAVLAWAVTAIKSQLNSLDDDFPEFAASVTPLVSDGLGIAATCIAVALWGLVAVNIVQLLLKQRKDNVDFGGNTLAGRLEAV